eukprot:75911_1
MSLLIVFISLMICIKAYIQSNVTCTGGRTDKCPNNGICNPNTMQCVDEKETIACGSNGDFLQCGLSGVVFGECGSGSGHDCYAESVCPDKSNAVEAINCNWPGLEPTNGYPFNATSWMCGNHGKDLSCKNNNGSVLIGVCGSTGGKGCKQYCTGYHGILCAKEEYFMIDWGLTNCQWIGASYGDWAFCPPGTIGVGHCGSGDLAECGVDSGQLDWHAIQCCPFMYF